MSARAYCNELRFNSIKENIDKLLSEGDVPILTASNESLGSKIKGYYLCISSKNYPKPSSAWSYDRSTHRNKALLKLNKYINENI